VPDEVNHGFSFNLWREPWITLERDDGTLVELGLADTITQAHRVSAIYDPSPVVVVGIHRLLSAILQAMYDPQRPQDLLRIQEASAFSREHIDEFGHLYANRFDLFSHSEPFLQSADLPLEPDKGTAKPISQLLVETSRSTALEHYRHGRDADEAFCPACAAHGLVTVPAFTSSGGRGLRPSINGVPPIYVIPAGCSLKESLARSLVLPRFQPPTRNRNADAPPWTRTPIVREEEVVEVGYLESLTFPARRIRLHPQNRNTKCSRCGRHTTIAVITMVSTMGRWRSKSVEPWQDPFVAYNAGKSFVPLRPQAGKALWRDFATLFLVSGTGVKQERRVRPLVLDQLAELVPDASSLAFRCVGVRTDMKAKVFEWFDAGFAVPTPLLSDNDAALHMVSCMQHATGCASALLSVFQKSFNRSSTGGERYAQIKAMIRTEFWRRLALSFNDLVLEMSQVQPGPARLPLLTKWADAVEQAGLAVMIEAVQATGDSGVTLRKRVQAEAAGRTALRTRRLKFLGSKETPHEG